MFLIDDILLSPAKALMFIFKEIHNKVMEEYCNKEKVYHDLGRLQYMLDTGEINEETFNYLENQLIQRLQEIEELEESIEAEVWDECPE